MAVPPQAAPHLTGPGQAEWLRRLDADLGNLRAALAFSLAQADPEPGLRLAASLQQYWSVRGHAAEGADVLRALLDTQAAQGATLPRARALLAAADLLRLTGGYVTAGDYCQEALAIARAAGDEHLVAEVLEPQARIVARQGQPGAAREALRLYRQASDQFRMGAVLANLGNYELLAGDLEGARRHLAEALDISREVNDRSGLIRHTFNLGLAEYLAGSPEAAEALFAETLDLAMRMGMRSDTAYALTGLALGHGRAGPGWQARLHGAADQAFADLGETIEPLEGQLADRDRQRLRAAMGAEAFDAEYNAGRALDPAQVLELRQDGAAPQERAGPGPGQRDDDFGALLRAFRERLSPQTAGIGQASPAARRVPGLRRDELARLAHVSEEHIRRLEQGRRRPSRAVVDALAEALRLDPPEHARLCVLAGFAAPVAGLLS